MSTFEVSLNDEPLYRSREFLSRISTAPDNEAIDTLRSIQTHVAEWVDDYDILSDGVNGSRYAAYSSYNRVKVERKLYPLVAKLGVLFKGTINEAELDRSLEFIDFAFDLYLGKTSININELNLADNIPPRIVLPSESRDSITPGLESPLVRVLPVLKYVPLQLRSQFALGIPPSIVGIHKDVNLGYSLEVLCPIFEDMLKDLSEDETLSVADKITSDTLGFCKSRLHLPGTDA